MYAQHQPMIADYASSSQDGFNRTILFVAVSVRIRFYRVGKELADIWTHGRNSRHAWGKRGDCWEWLIDHGVHLRRMLDGMDQDNTPIPMRLTTIAASVPGIGIAKAGFVLQLVYGKSGCLDVHNLKYFGLKESAFKADKADPFHRLLDRATVYHAATERVGTEDLWDLWCEHIADKYPTTYANADDVSALHVAYIQGWGKE